MDFPYLVDSLELTGAKLCAMADGLSDEQFRWKPADGAWSILEIMAHLADEEEQDFRYRLRSTLSNPSEPWPQIDPASWAVDRSYNEADPQEVLQRFRASRAESIQWLRSLQEPDLSTAYQHPKVGPVYAGELLASWAAHDCLHLRQVAKRMYQMVSAAAGEYDIAYAGVWSA